MTKIILLLFTFLLCAISVLGYTSGYKPKFNTKYDIDLDSIKFTDGESDFEKWPVSRQTVRKNPDLTLTDIFSIRVQLQLTP